jgi:hypothetical protein
MTEPVRTTTTEAATGTASDLRLVEGVADVLATPREDPADSFVLHAPLELVARTALLPFVAPEQRAKARERIVAVGTDFEAFGPPVAPHEEVAEYDSLAAGVARLGAAIEAGDLPAVDAAARWLGRTATATELRELLAADIVPRLSAAAHGPIFLHHLPRVAPRGEISGELLRGLAREVGRAPDWRLRWIDEPAAPTIDPGPDAMFEALATVPLGSREPGDTPFIYPLMARVDEPGTAANQLRGVVGGDDIAARGRAILRAAAWSMLLEPDDHAPYGWSHSLTMPQAVVGLGRAGVVDPRPALAVAGTYVVGFRSLLAERALVPEFPHDDPGLPLAEAFAAGPDAAAAAVWHGLGRDLDPRVVIGELTTRASSQRDAHLVKYTLACLDAAADDPEHARLFLSAAASLVGWWTLAATLLA